MNAPIDPTDAALFSLFPPAISPRGREGAREEATLDHPLGPFSGAPRQVEAAAEEGTAAASAELPGYLVETDEETAADEAVWLEFDEPEELVLDQATSDLVAATPAEEPEAPVELDAETHREPEPVGTAQDDETLIAAPEWEYGFDALSPEPAPARFEPAPVPAPAPEAEVQAEAEAEVQPEVQAAREEAPERVQAAPVVEEVAVRLEGIARALRERSPAELLAGPADPLQLLIAGYVLGLSESSRGPGESKSGGG